MTEAEWENASHPDPLLDHVVGRASVRKLRLVRCICFYRYTGLRNVSYVLGKLDLAERYADGVISHAHLLDGWGNELLWVLWPTPDPEPQTTKAALAVLRDARIGPWHTPGQADTVRRTEAGSQARLVRDLFGNPFRGPRLDPAWLMWNGGTIAHLARAIYQERAFERLPILADALEEAGCADADMLAYCRTRGWHVRGCWVIDLLIGKE